MATVNVTKYNEFLGSSIHSAQNFTTAVGSIIMGTIDIGAAENYVTGGISADLTGGIGGNVLVAMVGSPTNHGYRFDVSTNKLLVYTSTGQLAGASQVLRGQSVPFLALIDRQ